VDSHDFNTGILDVVEHRPWPMPAAPWVMTQTWHDLLFAHWPVDPPRLAAKIPAPLELDVYDGTAWLGIVPFRMTNVAPRAVPAMPFVSAFAELNVRTYVRYGGKPGVYFFSLDAASAVAVGVARTLFDLPYFPASMDVEQVDGTVRYRSRRTSGPEAEFVGTYRAVGEPFEARPGSVDYFLTERYCLYTVSAGEPRRLDIHHPPWPLQRADATIDVNTMAEASGVMLPGFGPLLHFARRQDMVAWLPTRCEQR
jgi:uncharacterized protein YqjF (DUF2071 family)